MLHLCLVLNLSLESFHSYQVVSTVHQHNYLLYISKRITWLHVSTTRWSPSGMPAHLLTPWSRALFEKLTGLQLVTKFSAFYGTRMFITKFTSARHLSLFWASSIQSIPLHPTSWRTILILPYNLRLVLPSGLFPSGFPTKTLNKPLHSQIHVTCPAHYILLDFISRTIATTAHYLVKCTPTAECPEWKLFTILYTVPSNNTDEVKYNFFITHCATHRVSC
jgi:hypothetical protein